MDPLRKSSTILDANHAQLGRWALWLRNFLPSPVRIGYVEAFRIAMGIAIGVLVTGWLSRWWGGDPDNIWMVSSLGASAVLLFGMPASPMAQPWPVLVGTIVSALVGALVQMVVPDVALACALAVGLSVMLMVPLRCMHPPGAGFAAYVVLEHLDGVGLVMFPVLFNIVTLLLCALLYNALTGRRYPHPQHSFKEVALADGHQIFSSADVDVALQHYNQVLDVSRADLEGLLNVAARSAFNRNFGNLRCQDIMTQPVFAVESGVSQKEAWALMRQEAVKALPVVDTQGHVLGIVSTADFVRQANVEAPKGVVQKLRNLLAGRTSHQGKVQELMETDTPVVQVDCMLVDLVPLFSVGNCHHLPVVDAQRKLVGIVTQTDLIRALGAAISVSSP